MKKVLLILALIFSNYLFAESSNSIQQPSTEKNWLEDFEKDTNPSVSETGYVQLPTQMQDEPQGSVFKARIRQIDSLNKKPLRFDLDNEVRKKYDFVNYANKIPRDLISYADRFYGATTEDEFKSIEAQIHQEMEDKRLLAAHPLESFLIGPFGLITIIILLITIFTQKHNIRKIIERFNKNRGRRNRNWITY